MKPFTETAVIEKPIDAVFAFAANPQNDPLWSPAVAEARQTSIGSLGIGTTFQQMLRLLAAARNHLRGDRVRAEPPARDRALLRAPPHGRRKAHIRARSRWHPRQLQR